MSPPDHGPDLAPAGLSPAERAARARDALWLDDHASKWLGMTLDEVTEARAVVSMTVGQNHCNGHGICHGGMIFSLADTAFAFACNSRNQATVAQHNIISFLTPGRLGDRLTATATEVSLTGRSGLYDIRVCNQQGVTVAEMRGMSRAIRGTLFDETPSPEAKP